MKKALSFKNRFLLVGMVGLLFTACEDGDNVIDSILRPKHEVPFFETIEVTENEIQYDVPTSTLTVDLAQQLKFRIKKVVVYYPP